MKIFARLTAFCFARFQKPIGILCIATLLLPPLMMYINLRNGIVPGLRFETMMSRAGLEMLFAVVYAMYLVGVAFSTTADIVGTKSIYTLLSIPGGSKWIYISKLIAALMWGLMLLACLLLSVLMSYGIYASFYRQEYYIDFFMKNGLFLAFVRSPLLRMLLPMSLITSLLSLLLGLGSVQAALFSSLAWHWKRLGAIGYTIAYVLSAIPIWSYMIYWRAYTRGLFIAVAVNVVLFLCGFIGVRLYGKGKVS